MSVAYQAKQVIVMRKDLNMRKGKMIAQGAHASLKGYKQADREHPAFKQWDEGSFAKICVSVDSEAELFAVAAAARAAGINVAEIIDAGNTEFGGVATPTCLALGPDWKDALDVITGHLKLL